MGEQWDDRRDDAEPDRDAERHRRQHGDLVRQVAEHLHAQPVHRRHATRGRRPQPGSYRVAPAPSPQIVAHHVVAELVIGRREDASAVALGQLVDEVDEALVLGEHEDVERRAAPRHLVGLGQGHRQRLGRRRPVEGVVAARQQVRGGFAVGDDEHDRLVLRVAVEESAGDQQRVLQVRALHHLGVETGQLGGLQNPCVVGKSDDLQRVLREPGAHQRVQRERG